MWLSHKQLEYEACFKQMLELPFIILVLKKKLYRHSASNSLVQMFRWLKKVMKL